MNKTLKPLLVMVHVEPDEVFGQPKTKNSWPGFKAGYDLMNGLRKVIEDKAGRPVHYCWQFRADGQIEKNYGARNWAFIHYRDEIDELLRCGDDIGLHQHAYRWRVESQTWVQDYADQAWVEDVTRSGFEAYKSVFGHVPASFSAGATWTNDALVRLVENLGASFDTSQAPGRDLPFPDYMGDYMGSPPDTDRMPIYPYQPSSEDFTVPRAVGDDGLWIIPQTSGLQSRGGYLKRTFRRVIGTQNRHLFTNKLYLHSPLEYLKPVFDAGAAASHFVLNIRSDGFMSVKNRLIIKRNLEYLMSTKCPHQFALVRPDELVEQFLVGAEA